jgi:hypothetical protein
MALGTHHAVGQAARTFVVQQLSVSGTVVELAGGFGDLLDAVDFAVEWLDREDPSREGAQRLVISEATGGASVEVWRYPAEPRGQGRELIELFGFDPSNWDAAPQYHPRPSSR